MRKFLNYLTVDEKGSRMWGLLFTIAGLTVAVFSGISSYSAENDFVKNFLPPISFVTGLACVYMLGKRKNIGNILGLFANIFEIIINVAFNALGFIIPSIYYFITHIIGYFDWKKNTVDGVVKIEKIDNKRDLNILIGALVFASFMLAVVINFNVIDTSQSGIFLWSNVIVMYIGILAQGLMILRYRVSWILWVVLNIFAIPIQFAAGNYVFGWMFTLYQINALLTVYAQYFATKGE